MTERSQRVKYDSASSEGTAKAVGWDIVYHDDSANGAVEAGEIIDENHYYAYGMEYSGFINSTEYAYKFNGIERIEAYQSDFAFYRGLDPILGRWYQVDPKAEAVMGMSPYCAMGNNPVSNSDPNGDLFFAIPQISFGSGGFSIGLEVGIGIPGVLSASVTGGVNIGKGGTSGYWSAQGSVAGFYAGYGSSGGFAGWGYRYAGWSAGISYGQNSGWGVGLSYGGTSTDNLNYSMGIGYTQHGGFNWNVSGGYTHYIEKPIIEPIGGETYEWSGASDKAISQKGEKDCLLALCEYFGDYSYEEIIRAFGELYNAEKGTQTLQALKKIYPSSGKLGNDITDLPDGFYKYLKERPFVIAQNKNHAVGLIKLQKVYAKYNYAHGANGKNSIARREFILTLMNPDGGKIYSIRKYSWKSPVFVVGRKKPLK